jgi:hypothetical protein
MAAVAGFLVTVHVAGNIDGRSSRRARSRRIRQSQFGIADSLQIYHNGWFRDQFRCSKISFDRICDMISENWSTKTMRSVSMLLSLFEIELLSHSIT